MIINKNMDIFERIASAKKTHSLNNRLLGEVVGDSESGFGQVMRRKKMPSLKEDTLNAYLDKLDNMNLQKKENPSPINEGFNFKEDNIKLVSENEFLKQTVKDLLNILKSK